MEKWNKLYAECEIFEDSEGSIERLEYTSEMLSEYEQLLGIKFPNSYKEFILVFGVGELAYHRIYGPVSDPTRKDMDIAEEDRLIHGKREDELLSEYGTFEEMEKFVFFSSSTRGDFYGWLTTEFTDKAKFEYRIYEFRRSPPIRPVADSFEQFIDDIVLEPDYEGKPRMEFGRT